jgi:mono/diheme cytochrome c family protein
MTPPDAASSPPQPRRRTANRSLLLGIWGLLLATVLAAGSLRYASDEAVSSGGGAPAQAARGDAARVARGRYLVTIASCNDCHTPLKMGPKGPEPDMDRMLSGHPEQMVMPAPPSLAPEAPWNWAGAGTLTSFAGPWGISYAANLTPDRNTGLGIWSREMFVKALRTGRHMGQSRPLLPPMPWRGIAQMTDDDLGAVYAYLRTIPPVHNRVPEPVIAPLPPAPAAGGSKG